MTVHRPYTKSDYDQTITQDMHISRGHHRKIPRVEITRKSLAIRSPDEKACLVVAFAPRRAGGSDAEGILIRALARSQEK